jgi:hypothetical protein
MGVPTGWWLAYAILAQIGKHRQTGCRNTWAPGEISNSTKDLRAFQRGKTSEMSFRAATRVKDVFLN